MDHRRLVATEIDKEGIEWYGNSADLLPECEEEIAEVKNTKRPKVAKQQVPLVDVRLHTTRKHCYAKHARVTLEYHQLQHEDVLIVLWQETRLFKVRVGVDDRLRDVLTIIQHKCLDTQVMRVAESARKAQNRRKARDTRSTRRQINKLYKEISSSDISLSYNDPGSWEICFSLNLHYVPQSLNKFSSETCSFLDRMFSAGGSSTCETRSVAHSPFIQKDFTRQIVSYTKSMVDSRAAEQVNVDGLNVDLLPFQGKSVSWMLAKESEEIPSVDFKNAAEICSFLNRYISFGYEMISTTVFWNRFTNFILTHGDVVQLYEDFIKMHMNQRVLGCRGLLSEEMGLGKTIEILALILKNKRRLDGESTFIDNDGKTIHKTKTTLIICPNAILQQWINEIESHTSKGLKVFHYKGFVHVKKYFGCENIQEIVKTLSDCDIIITSYNVVSMEIHYAEYNASLRPRRTISPIKYDYSSPLSLMQFFRIILDEVQMLHSDSTKAAKCTSLLHRVHTWGVSGTPIQLIRDYQTVLSYLKISPFCELPEIISTINLNVIYKKDQLFNGISFGLNDLTNFFVSKNLCIRHSKDDVFEQIHIPKQHNYIVPLEFAPVEWDNYLDLWNNFVLASGYGPDGSGSTRLSTLQLNQWLIRLRYLCCHAIFPDRNSNSKGNQSSNSNANGISSSLHNIDEVLKLMTSDAMEKLDSLYRDNYQMQIRSAQAKMELQNNPNDAIAALNTLKEKLFNDLRTKCNVDDAFNTSALADTSQSADLTSERIENNSKMRVRAYLDLLHQCFFFIATGYYLLGSSKLENVDHENEKLALLEKNIKAKSYTDVFDNDEMKQIEKYQELEHDYYTHAERLRERILIERVQKVESVIGESKSFFDDKDNSRSQSLTVIPFDETDDYSSNILVSRCFKMLSTLIHSLNKQAVQFNDLFIQLKQLLYKPILKTYSKENEEDKANEYTTSIEDQDKMFAIFACLEQLLSNRDLILSSDEVVKNPKKSLKPQPGQQFSEYHTKLISKLAVIGGSPMKQVFDDLKNSRIVRNVAGNSGTGKHSDDFENYLLEYEDRFNNMIKENNLLRDSLKKLNIVFNSKLEYYSHLQKISDSLVSLLQLENSAKNSIMRSINNELRNQQHLEKISTAESRVKYLNSLNMLKEGIESKKSFQCPICLGGIRMGAIIKCGHFFCRRCISNWLKHHDTCPMCKTKTSIMEVYNFRFQNEDTETLTSFETPSNSQGSDQLNKPKHGGSLNSNENVFKEKYSLYNESNEVHKILIKESFGAKIDFVVKLILFLRMKSESENEVPPQFVLYSQSFDFLKVIYKVLHIHDISQLTCWANVSNIGETINKFKRDNTITCLLLNVKALGAGLNLLNARHVFLLDPIINQGDELQAMGRNNRIGQTKETYVWNFMIRNSVEENILKHKCILEGKKKTKIKESLPAVLPENEDESAAEDERTEFEMNESTGEQVAGKHLWNCFFQNAEVHADYHSC